MSVVSVVGLPSMDSTSPIRRFGSIKGIGKTMLVVYLGALEKSMNPNRQVYSNFDTSFSEKKSLKEIVKMLMNNETKVVNPLILVTEMHLVLSNFESEDRKFFYGEFVRQIRKLKADMIWDTQREMDINKMLREETEFSFTTEKYHYSDDSLCPIDTCDEHHYIRAFQLKPTYSPLYDDNDEYLKIDCDIIGKLYNTNEIIVREVLDDE